MTSHYLEYTVALPASDSGEISHLLGRLWQRLHGVLAGANIQHLGVSLPRAGAKHPGNVLRLHSDAQTLQQVLANAGIRQLVESTGMVTSAVLPVPTACAYRCYTRSRQSEKFSDAWILRSESRLLQHLEKKGVVLSISELLARRKRLQERAALAKRDAVYIKLQSHSTRQTFSLLVNTAAVNAVCAGQFSHYGLAIGADEKMPGQATVPFW